MKKRQITFIGKITYERLNIFFSIDDPIFLQMIKMLVREEFIASKYKYRINANIASMVLAWCLELGNIDDSHWLMNVCVRE